MLIYDETLSGDELQFGFKHAWDGFSNLPKKENRQALMPKRWFCKLRHIRAVSGAPLSSSGLKRRYRNSLNE